MSSYDAYLVRLEPQDDNGYAHITKLGGFVWDLNVKLLSPAEGDELRALLLADNELGKTVGVNGVAGEGYIVLNTFPRMDELHKFFKRVANEGYTSDQFYSVNAKKKAAAAAAAAAAADVVPKSDKGGFRRRSSLRKSSKRAQRKKSRATKLR